MSLKSISLLVSLIVFSCNTITSKKTGTDNFENKNSTGDTLYNHHFIARLYKGFNSSVYCGGITTAYAYKFKVIDTDLKDLKNKWIVVIQPCPDMLGDNFFQTNKIYKIITGGTKMSDNVSNSYEKENLPTFWAKEILLAN